ncbi:MAG: hypothetical protein WAQ99_18550 [Pyrinomonadaceae bacterium]
MSTPPQKPEQPKVSQPEEITLDDLDGVTSIEAGSKDPSAASETNTHKTDGTAENIYADLTGVTRVDPHVQKAHDAFAIAVIIVGTFSAAILITLLIVVGILWKSGDPNRVKVFADAVSPIYESLGKFVTPVFGSLLAFILGYYYSKEQQQKN